MAEIAPEIAKTVATSIMGSVVSNATSKGADAAGMSEEEVSTPMRVGIKVSEVLLSSIMTAIAITIFTKLSKKVKGPLPFVCVATVVSVASALAMAYLKIVM
jgi:hypothetical protein